MREIYKDDTIHCVEYEPQCRTVTIKATGFQRDRKYYLSFPYIQFTTIKREGRVRETQSFHATVTNKPLRSINYKSSYLLLPSIYPMCGWDAKHRPGSSILTSQVCLHGMYGRADIFEMISYFWQTPFAEVNNWKSMECLPNTSLKSFLIWSEKTQEDPSFIMKVKWPLQLKISNLPKLGYQEYCCVPPRRRGTS